MKWMIAWVGAGVALCASFAVAGASGAWRSDLRAFTYTDLIVDGDSVWCATQEAGLLRYSIAAGTFESISREPGGLASNRLNAIAFDRTHRLWAGSTGSGASFLSADGAKWTAVNTFDGLPSDTVNTLEVAGDTLWIATSQGIALWNGSEIAGVLPDRTGASPFASNNIRGVAVLRDSVWLGTANGIYLGRISAGLSSWIPMNAGLPTRNITGLASDGASLLALDSLRVLAFNVGTSTWTATADIGVVRRLSDDTGRIAAASARGIHLWTGTTWTLVNSLLISRGNPRSDFAVTTDPAGRVYAANLTGIYRQPDGAGAWPSAAPNAPPGNNVLNLALDGPLLYMTTTDEGIGRFDGSRWKTWIPGAAPGESDTTFRQPSFPFALLVDRVGRRWTGCWDTALESFDERAAPPDFRHYWTSPDVCPPACSDTVASHTFAWASAADSVGGRWFGMAANGTFTLPAIGLEYYDALGNYAANYRPGTSAMRGAEVHALAVDRNGRVWIGYRGQGIDYFDWPPPTGTRPFFLHVGGTDNEQIEGLGVTSSKLWAVTNSELKRFNLSGDLELSYDLPSETFDLAVHPLEIGPDGSIWVATSGGVFVVAPDGSARTYTTANSPLVSNGVRAIRVERATGLVWIGTGAGINRFDPSYVAPAPALTHLDFRVFPNPARLNALSLDLHVIGEARSYRGAVFDLTGRAVRRFRANDGEVIWDGRGPDGNLVKPGIYFIQAESSGRSGVVRAVLVR